MKKFYQIENNTIINVVQIEDNLLVNSDNNIIMEMGIVLCKQKYGHNTNWIFSDKLAFVGDSFVPGKIIPQQPFPSWILNEETNDWEAPVPMPTLSNSQKEAKIVPIWREDEQVWQLVDETSITF